VVFSPSNRAIKVSKLSSNTLKSKHILNQKIRSLDLEKSFISDYSPLIETLYNELAERGITFRPKIYLSDEWFSPDDSPVIAVPFYFANKSLRTLAKEHLVDVDGMGSKESFLKLLRHECGHAIETAYNLKYSRTRQNAFGLFSSPYPSKYYPNLKSKNFINYLGDGYAQAHPAEDFAETFAFWLEHGEDSFNKIAKNTLAYKKLKAMDKMMASIKGIPQKVKTKKKIDSYKEVNLSVESFLSEKRKHLNVDKKLNIFNRRLVVSPTLNFNTPNLTSKNSYQVFIGELNKFSNKPQKEISEAELTQKYKNFMAQKLHHYVM
jgi:hypothetical protein